MIDTKLFEKAEKAAALAVQHLIDRDEKRATAYNAALAVLRENNHGDAYLPEIDKAAEDIADHA